MKFSDRTDWNGSENELAKLKALLEEEKKPVLDLTVSNPTQCGFQYMKPELLTPLTDPRNLLYRPASRGLLEARKSVSRYYAKKNISISPNQIVLTASTSEAYALIFRLIGNPGDELITPAPSYPLFDYLAGLNDLTLKRYHLIYEKNWRIQSIFPAARAVIVVNPNNPTGNFIHSEEFDLVNRFALTNGAAIISDEVFFDFAFAKPGTDVRSFAQNKEALTFTLGGISKAIGLPQMKLAWIVVSGPDESAHEAVRRLEIICDTYLSVNTPSQNALSDWLERGEEIRGEILNRVKANRSVLIQKLSGVSGVSVLEAEGGWYAIVRIDAQGSDEEWALLLLREHGVFVHPGYFYDFPEGNFLVLSLLPPLRIFEEGVSRMARALNSSSQKSHELRGTY